MKCAVLITALTLVAMASPVAADELKPAAGDYIRPKPKDGYSYPECFCTDSQGNRVEVGQLACLTIGQRQITSRCEKRRNLVIWRHQQEGCGLGV